MKFEKELKTLEEALKETNVNIIPYSITDIYMYESVIALEELEEKLDRECTELQMGLHYGTKDVPEWIETDEDFVEWSNGIDADYEELDKMVESTEMLFEMIEDLRKQIIVYTEVK